MDLVTIARGRRDVGELDGVPRSGVVDLNARSFAAASRRIHDLSRFGASGLREETDPERFTPGLQDFVLSVRLLREQPANRSARPKRPVLVRSAGKLIPSTALCRGSWLSGGGHLTGH